VNVCVASSEGTHVFDMEYILHDLQINVCYTHRQLRPIDNTLLIRMFTFLWVDSVQFIIEC